MPEERIRNLERHCAAVEAVLFATPEPLTISEIAKHSRVNPEYIPRILKLIEIRCQSSDRGITLSKIGDSYKLSVKHELVKRIIGLTKSELSRGLLRVLSLIAYNQPVVQSEIVKVVGNRTYEYVKELEKMGFVKAERKGKSKMLTVTPAFESYFETSPEQLKQEMAKLHEQEKTKEAKEGIKEQNEQQKQNENVPNEIGDEA